VVSRIGAATCPDWYFARPGPAGGSAGLANGDDGGLVLRRVARLGYAMCANIAVIAVLMEVKPF
jgi:hypothetical protein